MNDTGVVDGITYTKRDRDGLLALVGTADETELVTSCTTGVTDMKIMFFVRFDPRLLLLCCFLIALPLDG